MHFIVFSNISVCAITRDNNAFLLHTAECGIDADRKHKKPSHDGFDYEGFGYKSILASGGKWYFKATSDLKIIFVSISQRDQTHFDLFPLCSVIYCVYCLPRVLSCTAYEYIHIFQMPSARTAFLVLTSGILVDNWIKDGRPVPGLE